MKKDIPEKDAQIEYLNHLLKQANESKPNPQLFQEFPFDFENPFKGDLRKKFNNICDMKQFETHQRVQLILNKVSRISPNPQQKLNYQLTNDLKDAQQKKTLIAVDVQKE